MRERYNVQRITRADLNFLRKQLHGENLHGLDFDHPAISGIARDVRIVNPKRHYLGDKFSEFKPGKNNGQQTAA